MPLPPATAKEQACVDLLMKELDYTPGTQCALLDPEDKHFMSENTLLRFARVKDGDFKAAREMLMKCIEWRKEHKPYLITSDEVRPLLDHELCIVSGIDKSYNSALVAVKAEFKNSLTADERVKKNLFILEETQRRGYDLVTWILDFSTIKVGKPDSVDEESRKRNEKNMVENYPGRTVAMYFYAMPLFLRTIHAVVRQGMDARIRATMHQITKEEDLFQLFGKDQLPKFMGGTVEGSGYNLLMNLPHESTLPPAVPQETEKMRKKREKEEEKERKVDEELKKKQEKEEKKQAKANEKAKGQEHK